MLRDSSRDTVDAGRPSARPIARTPWPAARKRAISSRSARLNRTGPGRRGAFPITPPAWRNNRAPVGAAIPTDHAAGFTATPDRTRSQNSTCTDRGNHRNFRTPAITTPLQPDGVATTP
ncbi:hypothetical protein GCM10027360_38950 [Amycolatopsis echigonensis]